MLAIRPETDRSPSPTTEGLGDHAGAGRQIPCDLAIEGVIYYTPDGDGYIIYDQPRPGTVMAPR